MSFIGPLALCLRKIDKDDISTFLSALQIGVGNSIIAIKKVKDLIKTKYAEYQKNKLKQKVESTKQTQKDASIEVIREKYESFLIRIDMLQYSIESQLAQTNMELTYDSIMENVRSNINWGPLIIAAYDVYDTAQGIERDYPIDTIEPDNATLIVKAVFDLLWYNEIKFYKDYERPPTIQTVTEYIDEKIEKNVCKNFRPFKVNPQLVRVPRSDKLLIGAKVIFFKIPNPEIYAELNEFIDKFKRTYPISQNIPKKTLDAKVSKLLKKY
jgi:hypothetical protein